MMFCIQYSGYLAEPLTGMGSLLSRLTGINVTTLCQMAERTCNGVARLIL